MKKKYQKHFFLLESIFREVLLIMAECEREREQKKHSKYPDLPNIRVVCQRMINRAIYPDSDCGGFFIQITFIWKVFE